MASPTTELDRTLAALAEPIRRQVVETLRDGPRKASDLADISGVSRPLMSRHLRVLRLNKIIEEVRVESDARLKLYRLREPPFLELSSWLNEIRAFWGDQLMAFKKHLETRRQGEEKS